jgi:hypothetical protein
VFGIHGPFWDQIRDLQVVQVRAGLLRFRVATKPEADRTLIQRTVKQRMPMVGLEFEYVPVIQRSPSGKRRYFVDGLKAAAVSPPPAGRDGVVLPQPGRGPHRWRWIAAAAVVLAVLAVAMSLLVVRAGDGRPAIARAHHARDPGVSVKASARHGFDATVLNGDVVLHGPD